MLFLVLPSPWDAVAFAVFLIAGAIEVVYWWRQVKGRRIETGAEAMIGSLATVTSACRPEGQVRADGALWKARCDDGADPGDSVRVTQRTGLTLIVENEEPSAH